MERRLILRSMARQWWIFLVVLLITVGATLFLTMRQTPIYKARATYLIRLNSEIIDPKTISDALDTLNRNDELLGTYSEIAMSQMIKRQAGTEMGLSASDLRAFSVSSRTVPGSKVLEISVEGEDLEATRDFAGGIGEETMTYVNGLYPSYTLTLLDPPTGSSKPISPKLPFNLVLGTVLGGFLGLVALLLSSWLRGDLQNISATPSNGEELNEYLPVRREIKLLLQEFEHMRAELSQTRRVLQDTESQAKNIHTILDSMPKNGQSYGKRR